MYKQTRKENFKEVNMDNYKQRDNKGIWYLTSQIINRILIQVICLTENRQQIKKLHLQIKLNEA